MDLQTAIKPPLPDLDLILVEGGEFLMGDDNSEYGGDKPAHRVEVSSFYMAKYPVTQRLYEAVMGKNPSNFKGPMRPVERVSWEDAQVFIKKLNGLKDVGEFLRLISPPGEAFRLPTEAEWEYAARGGRYSQDYLYAGSDRLKQVGWYRENGGDSTKDVGLLLANELGLHDMSGNVREWCEDWYGGSEYYEECRKKGVVKNPAGPVRGASRVGRGGSWASALRTAASRTASTTGRGTAIAISASASCCPSLQFSRLLFGRPVSKGGAKCMSGAEQASRSEPVKRGECTEPGRRWFGAQPKKK